MALAAFPLLCSVLLVMLVFKSCFMNTDELSWAHCGPLSINECFCTRLQLRSGVTLVLPWTTPLHRMAFPSLDRNGSWKTQVTKPLYRVPHYAFRCRAYSPFSLTSLTWQFPHLTDEPESKKLAAQSDLESAKALCEFISFSFALLTVCFLAFMTHRWQCCQSMVHLLSVSQCPPSVIQNLPLSLFSLLPFVVIPPQLSARS